MARDFLPSREGDLVTWLNNFQAKINSAPTSYGLTAAMATANGTLTTSFINSLNIARAEATRSPMNITLKNTAKRAVIDNVRMLARLVQGTPTVTPAQKQDLGLNPRDVIPSPIPAPGSAPQLTIVSVNGHLVRVRLSDPANPSRRGIPDGINGAIVMSYVGETAPTDPSLYKMEGPVSRTTVDVLFPNTLAAGTTVWLTAVWFNERKQLGPACAPVATNINYGGSMPMAA